MGALSQSGLMLDERALRSVAPALNQLYSVFNEVTSFSLSSQEYPQKKGFLCAQSGT